MKSPSNLDAHAVVHEFMLRCFDEKAPPLPPNKASATWVLEQFSNRDSLQPTDIAKWSKARRSAAYERLHEAIKQLRREPSTTFRPDELDRSTPGCLVQPLLADLATVPVPSPS
jgi:hypothetical protein